MPLVFHWFYSTLSIHTGPWSFVLYEQRSKCLDRKGFFTFHGDSFLGLVGLGEQNVHQK